MEDISHNKYFNKPIEEVVECLKLQRQKLIELKEKQKYLIENEPDNEQLKEQYEKERSEIVTEIKQINEYNEHLKKLNENEIPTTKVEANSNNMSFAGDISRRGDQPTIDEIKILLTDNNSVSEDELQHHNKIQNDYKKYIQERYNDLMGRRQNMNPQMTELMMRNRNRFDINKGRPMVDEFDEDLFENNNKQGSAENLLKDLNDINELNKVIQRSKISEDDIEMMKNRVLPPTPVTTGIVTTSIPDSPMKYPVVDKYSNDSPNHRPLDNYDTLSNHHDNYDTLSDRGYDGNPPPEYMNNDSYNRNTVGYMENHPIMDKYYPSARMNQVPLSEAAALEWDQLKREVEKEELIEKLEIMDDNSDIDLDINMNMNMNRGMNRGMPMNMRMNRGMPMNMGMNRGMNMGMPMDMGMNRGMNMGMPMDMRMNRGMNMGMPMNMGMNMGMPMDMGMGMGMDMDMELDLNMDSIMESNNEYKGNKALKVLGVGAGNAPRNKYSPTSPKNNPNNPYVSPNHPYISPTHPYQPNQKISIVPTSDYIPMSGVGLGKNPIRIGDQRNANRNSLERIERMRNPINNAKSYKALGINTNIVGNAMNFPSGNISPEHTPILKNNNSPNKPINRNSSNLSGPMKRINEIRSNDIRNSTGEILNDSMLSNNSNNSNGNTKRYSKNRVTNSMDFSRPRDPKDMRPEEKLDAMLLPSLTTLRQISINELVATKAKSILASGFLLKRSSNLFKKWKQRYFILCSDNLYCFATDQSKERALSCIPITKDAVVRTQVEDNKYIFVLIAVWYEFNIIQREFYLQTNTEEEMNLWIKQLKKAINVEKLKRTSLPKVPEIPPAVMESVNPNNNNKRYSQRNSNIDNNNSSITANNNNISNTAKYGTSNRISEEITYRNNDSFSSTSTPSVVNEAFIKESPTNENPTPSSATSSDKEDQLVFPTRVSSADRENRLKHEILKNQQELEKLYNRNNMTGNSDSYSKSSSSKDTPSHRSNRSNPSYHSNHSNPSYHSNHSNHNSTNSNDPDNRILKDLNTDDRILKDLNLDEFSDDSDFENNYSEKNEMYNSLPREENRMRTREGNPRNENINRARMRRQNQHQRTRSVNESTNNSTNNSTNISNMTTNNSSYNRSETIVIDGSSDENANLFVYQKILTSNKTNYRFDKDSISIKTSENEDSKVKDYEDSRAKETENEDSSKTKDYKNISSSSISVSTTSPFTSSMSSSLSSFSLSSLSSPSVSENDDSMDEEHMKKKIEKKHSHPTTHKIKRMNNGTKKINVLIDSLDKLKMTNSSQEDKPIISKNPMLLNPDKSRSETDNSTMITQTEEYFNKALSELAALQTLSKNI